MEKQVTITEKEYNEIGLGCGENFREDFEHIITTSEIENFLIKIEIGFDENKNPEWYALTAGEDEQEIANQPTWEDTKWEDILPEFQEKLLKLNLIEA